LLADELVFPACIAHVVNQPLAPELRYALSAGLADNLRVFMTSGRANSRFEAMMSLLKGHMDLGEAVSILCRRRTVESYFFESNFSTFAPDFVFNALPDCKLIHVVRDGRDCADWLCRMYDPFANEKLNTLAHSEMFVGREYERFFVPWWVEPNRDREFIEATPYLRCVWMWKEMINRFRQFAEGLESSARHRVLVVRYEDYVHNAPREVERIVSFIGRSMTDLSRKQLRQFHTKHLGFSVRRSFDDLNAATALSFKELAYLGYSTASTPSTCSANGDHRMDKLTPDDWRPFTA
jgi:hypothetical protein